MTIQYNQNNVSYPITIDSILSPNIQRNFLTECVYTARVGMRQEQITCQQKSKHSILMNITNVI